MAVLPPQLWSFPSRVLRTKDLGQHYARPADEVRRLASAGVLRPVAHGYWLVPPPEHAADTTWRPEIEALALGLAVADYGPGDTTLMGISAARLLGVLPRAISTAVVTTPKQRRQLQTPYGTLRFVTRRVQNLQLRRVRTELVEGYATDVEQTLLDLAQRPDLGDADPSDVSDALALLASRADWTLVEEVATASRQRSTAARLKSSTDAHG